MQEGGRQTRQRLLIQAAIIDSTELVDEQVGGASQPAGGRDADAERLGILREVRGERDIDYPLQTFSRSDRLAFGWRRGGRAIGGEVRPEGPDPNALVLSPLAIPIAQAGSTRRLGNSRIRAESAGRPLLQIRRKTAGANSLTELAT